MTQNALFISYDSLLDPLGSSQILPYIESIARRPRYVHVLSFKKPAKLDEGDVALRCHLKEMGTGWTRLPFTRGGKLAKLWDLFRMYNHALRLQRRHGFGIVHAGSYQAAQVACLLKRLLAVKVLFDMRGLWVDERVDGGLWRPDHWVDRMAYRAYKWVERRLLYCADHVVPLTRRVLSELDALAPRIRVNVSVIRCCADFSHFRILTNETSSVVCRRIGIDRNAVVLSYLGSSGTWYMLDDMLRFLIQTARIRTDIEFLLITRNWGASHMERMRKLGGGDLEGRLHVVSSSRDEVPEYVGSSDLMLSFIKPDYSKIANSPTKLAETYASGTGTPVVSADCSSGPREILEYGGLVSVGDRVALADAIKDASKSAHHHDALKRRAFDIGVAHSTDKHVTLVLKQQDGVL